LSENAPLKGHSRGYAIQREIPHKQTAPSCLSPSELLRPSITTRLLPHFRSSGDSPRGWCKSRNGERIEICPGIALFDCWPIIECTHKQICRHGDLMGIHAGTATHRRLSRLRLARLGCRTFGYAGMFGQLSRAGHMESRLGRWLPATSSRSHYIYTVSTKSLN